MNKREQIVDDIFRTGWLYQQCLSVCYDRFLADDLVQEIGLIILEYKPKSSLDIAYSKNQHLPLIRKIITNQFNSKTSPFYTKYKKFAFIELNENITKTQYEEKYSNN